MNKITKPKIVFMAIVFMAITFGSLFLYQSQKQENTIARCAKKCNVILIIEDTLSAKHMGIYGSKNDTTPFIDKFFSKNSIVYDNMWSTSYWTWMSFASFMRSKYPSDITGEDILFGRDNLTELLDDGGIDVYGILQPPNNFITQSIYLLFKEKQVIPYLSKYVRPLKRAKSWLKDRKPDANRFFLMVHDSTVHDPYNPPAEYRKLFNSKKYVKTAPLMDLMQLNYTKKPPTKSENDLITQWEVQYDQDIRYFDGMVRDLIGGMSQKVLNNTIIIIMADHGEAFNEHGKLIHQNLYSEIVHVPFLIWIPRLGKNITIKEPRSLIGLTPTILSMMNVAYNNKSFSGTSFFINNKGNIPDRVIAEREKRYVFKTRLGPGVKLEDMHLNPQDKVLNGLQSVALQKKNVSVIYTEKKVQIYLLDKDPYQKNSLDINSVSLNTSEKQIAYDLIKEASQALLK